MAIGLDQIPEALVPALLSCVVLPLGWFDILAIVMLFFVANLVLSRLLFHLHLRDRPH
jgi:CDP-2,3-bis-(O-geranylgeranyl)-sn-glycerol synthase